VLTWEIGDHANRADPSSTYNMSAAVGDGRVSGS